LVQCVMLASAANCRYGECACRNGTVLLEEPFEKNDDWDVSQIRLPATAFLWGRSGLFLSPHSRLLRSDSDPNFHIAQDLFTSAGHSCKAQAGDSWREPKAPGAVHQLCPTEPTAARICSPRWFAAPAEKRSGIPTFQQSILYAFEVQQGIGRASHSTECINSLRLQGQTAVRGQVGESTLREKTQNGHSDSQLLNGPQYHEQVEGSRLKRGNSSLPLTSRKERPGSQKSRVRCDRSPIMQRACPMLRSAFSNFHNFVVLNLIRLGPPDPRGTQTLHG
jgi:hypothetical protein